MVRERCSSTGKESKDGLPGDELGNPDSAPY
jgi:hypothetical protein